jgi:hypothetical protein
LASFVYIVERRADLPEVARHLAALALRRAFCMRGKEHRDEARDDADDDEQLDEGEAFGCDADGSRA